MSYFSQLFGNPSKMSAQEAKSIMDSGESYTLLDVRTSDEYRNGHIRGAKSLPLAQLQQTAERAIPNKDAKILIYCASGARSGNAASMLKNLGYTDVHNFGGIMSWPYGMIE